MVKTPRGGASYSRICDVHCSPRVANQLRLIGALIVWILCLLVLFPPKRVINERPLAKFITSEFEHLNQEDKLYATVYASYLADLPADHPDVLLHKAISDQELSEFMVHGGRSLTDEDFKKYRNKSYDEEFQELKERAAFFLDQIGTREFNELKETVKEQLLIKIKSWPEQTRRSVMGLMEYTAELHPASLGALPTQSVLQMLNSWQRMADENKEKYWPKETP